MTIRQLTAEVIYYVRSHARELIILGVWCLFAYTFAAYIIVQKHHSRSLRIDELPAAVNVDQFQVGIVFGGGVTEQGPRPLLQDRLDKAAELLQKGYINTLILSGDNRYLNYNEPREMFEYLTQQYGINPDQLQADYAGRSTYETCERAHKVFGLDKAILITESTHLPRALYLCNNLGMTSYGVQSDGQASAGAKIGQRWREVLARNKAIFNVMVWGEPTVLGEPIDISN